MFRGQLKNVILAVTSVIILLCFSCGTTEPPPLTILPDSTSHEIIWEADTLGDFNSRLDAVWGSSPNDIWVAGWITRGNWGTNLVHYNGEIWEDYDYFEADLNGMFGLNSNDIWAVGSNLIIPNRDALIAHYNGTVWETTYIDTSITILTAVWASASNNVFAVGLEGTILHFNGSAWTKMETSSKRNLFDVWGFGSSDVYASGGFSGEVGDTSKPILLHYDGNTWSSLLDTVAYYHKHISTLWGSSSNNVYFQGVYEKTGLFNGNYIDGWNFVPIPDDNTAINKMRGSSSYNVFLVGSFGIVVHYNGRSWHRYDELLAKPGGAYLQDLIVFDTTVYIVGNERTTNKAIVYNGRIPE
jgi:hypothetical protein